MIITDPKELSRRHALQQDYLITMESIVEVVSDLSKKQNISNDNYIDLKEKISHFINSYMDLQSSLWKQTSAESRDKIVQLVFENIIKQIPNYKSSPSVVEAYIIKTIPALAEASHIKYLQAVSEIQTNQTNKT